MGDRTKQVELSQREQQLITLAADGLTDAGIAHRLDISETTVKSYWGRVRTKLGPRNRTELVALAMAEESRRALTELNQRIEDLESELRSAQLSAQAGGLDLYKELLKNAPDSFFVVDQGGSIAWMNVEAAHAFGYSFDELVGQPISTLIPDRFREAHHGHMKDYRAQPEHKLMGDHFPTLGLRKDGEEFSISATLALVQTPAGDLVVCVVRSLEHKSAMDSFVAKYGLKTS